MKLLICSFTALVILLSCKSQSVKNQGSFDVKKDLLLVQFDCKTDVDDLQTAAALATLLNNPEFSGIRYHAVAGTYGIQGGLYVPPDDLFELAFGDNWTDAHANVQKAADKVLEIVKSTLENQGDIWIAEAGQSDFTARLIKAVQLNMTEIKISQRIHVVQHSNWNEESTSYENLTFVRTNVDYHKIADGNVVGNGTPGFRSPEFTDWKKHLTDDKIMAIWQLAVELSNKYNGREGRYHNEAISSGGLDFSDLSEVCWILGLQHIKDAEAFFMLYAK